MLLRGRWHRVQEATADPEKWRGRFELPEPLSAHPLRERLTQVWQRVMEGLGLGAERQRREAQRQRNRQVAEAAVRYLWGRFGQEAKRRLAQHHTVMVICADQGELPLWEQHLRATFPSADKVSGIAGFVYWITTPTADRMALVVWNGAVPSAPEHYIHAHEIAHVVDGDPQEERFSGSHQWLNLWDREKHQLARKFLDLERRERLLKDPVEAFAILLATAWIEPRHLQGYAILDYFREHALLLS